MISILTQKPSLKFMTISARAANKESFKQKYK
jgi:hypothetical protein